MADLVAGVAINALELQLELEPVTDEHNPAPGTVTGAQELATWQGLELGVWEMGVGQMHDTEADEIFIVLGGEATVEFLEPSLETVTVKTGDIVKLTAGMRTRWTVTAPLRKVYLTPA